MPLPPAVSRRFGLPVVLIAGVSAAVSVPQPVIAAPGAPGPAPAAAMADGAGSIPAGAAADMQPTPGAAPAAADRASPGAAAGGTRAADDGAVVAAELLPGERIVLDGRLSHPAWQRAPAHTRFHTVQPHPDQPPVQRTEVRVLFDARALYVGVVAHDDDPSGMRSPIVRVDQVNRTQDFVAVYIDAIGTGSSAQFFRLSAAGSMGDGIHTAADDSEDFLPDFDWDGAVAPLPDGRGWSAVLRLPLASLRFGRGGRDWRMMVARRLPRAQFHLLASVPIPRGVSSFIERLQPLRGVRLPEDSGFLTVRPGLTLKRESGDDTPARSRAVASLDVKWRPLPEAVVDLTLNPDFSQVALDVPQLAGNTRFALFTPEKRPFFFESADLWRSPTDAVYTRSFTAPRWGLRGTWRSDGAGATALALHDRGGALVLLPGPYGTGIADQPASQALALRARSDGGAVQWGAVAALRRYRGDGAGDDKAAVDAPARDRGINAVAGPDVAWQIDDAWRLRAQWLRSRTTALPSADGTLARGPAVDGDRRFARLQHLSNLREAALSVDDIDAGFRHDSGFVNQVGVRRWQASAAAGKAAVGPFNELWANVEAVRTTDRRTGEVVASNLRPGVWLTAANNLEWWGEWHGLSRVRTASGGPLLHERFVATGLVMTPARWMPLLDAKLTAGRLADTTDDVVRPGATLRVSATLRPLPRLELEPSVSTALLKGQGRWVYREAAWQALAVWHFDARHTLRLVATRSALDRRADAGAEGAHADGARREGERAWSLTYAWRESAGTRLYVGATRLDSGRDALRRRDEVFVKLQFDWDEARGWWSGPVAR